MTIVHHFSTPSPDHILNALDSLELRTDGRLLALNSYENRVYVYLVGLKTGQVDPSGNGERGFTMACDDTPHWAI